MSRTVKKTVAKSVARMKKQRLRLFPKVESTVQNTEDPGYVRVKITITKEVQCNEVNDFLKKYGAKPIS